MSSVLSKIAFDRGRRRLTGIVLLALLYCSAAGAASAFEFSRQVADLNFASERLAQELRGTLGYGSLRGAAERLADDAEQLQQSISVGRSHNYVRLQINDVRRRYQQLQVAVARALSKNADVEENHNALVARHMEGISEVYDALDAGYYYSERDYPGSALYSPYVYTAPVIVYPGVPGSGEIDPGYLPDEVRRWIETGRSLQPRSAAEIRAEQRAIGEHTGIEQGFDQRSAVLDRQTRRQTQQP